MTDRKMNEKELEAVKKLYDRNPDGASDLDQFKGRFAYNSLNGCWMGNWCKMVMGIESDGYTHS
jgi:hypothetical protein